MKKTIPYNPSPFSRRRDNEQLTKYPDTESTHKEISSWLNSNNNKPSEVLLQRSKEGEIMDFRFYAQPYVITQLVVLMICGEKKHTYYASKALSSLYRIGLSKTEIDEIFISKIRKDVLEKYTY